MDTDRKTFGDRITGESASQRTHASRGALSLSSEPPARKPDERNTDPYNTSGSFDRTKNWARVGKR